MSTRDEKVEARAIYLCMVMGVTQKKAADKLGKSRNWVANALERNKGKKWEVVVDFNTRELAWVCDLEFPELQSEVTKLLDVYVKNGTLTRVFIRSSGWDRHDATAMHNINWDARIKTFGEETAPFLDRLLSSSKHMAVTWGETVHSPGIALGLMGSQAKREEPLHVYAANGDMKYIENRPHGTSSSTLAETYAMGINGDSRNAHSLSDLVDFISKTTQTDDAVMAVREHYESFPQYKKFFGPNGGLEKLDSVVTSCGDFDQDRHFVRELRECGVAVEQIRDDILGDIGGAWIPHDDSLQVDNLVHGNNVPPGLREMAHRWMGMSVGDYKKIALETKNKQRPGPGVILLALGSNKAEIVRQCLERRLVNVLVIDEDLGNALSHI